MTPLTFAERDEIQRRKAAPPAPAIEQPLAPWLAPAMRGIGAALLVGGVLWIWKEPSFGVEMWEFNNGKTSLTLGESVARMGTHLIAALGAGLFAAGIQRVIPRQSAGDQVAP